MTQFSLLTATCLAVLTLLCPSRARGQTTNRPGTSLFGHLDRTRIPGGLLWRMPKPDSATVMYNGSADSVATWKTREQLISSLQGAAFDSVPGLARLPRLRQRFSTTATVPLALLNYRYGAIKAYAVDSALLVIDGTDSTYRDGPNHRESPYAEERLFVLAPLAGVSNRATVSFQLDADALLTNRPETLTSLLLDCGDGAGWRPLALGAPVQTTYATTGPKTLRLRALTSTGDTLQAAATYHVARLTTAAPDLTGTLTTNGLPAQSLPGCYDAGVHGQFATAYWYTRFGAQNTSGQIRRPVIFVEGIDFGRELNYQNNSTNHGEFGWDMFVNGGGINQQGEPDYQQLVEMPLLLQSLHDRGYDVVLLDFEWGADLIQKNAMTLVQLLTQLEQQGLDEPAAVVGTSMGGLVSRYALAWMEQNNYAHCARLWTSFDSPQNVNANVPYGMQHMINFFADNLHIAAAESGQRRVRSPAAAQMLVYQAWDQSGCYRSQFQNLLNSTGLNPDHMPERLRRVAISNGSKLGLGQGFNAGNEIIHYEYNFPGIFNQVFRSNVWAVPNSPGAHSSQVVFDGRALNVLSPWNLTCAAAILGATHLGIPGYVACVTVLNTNGPYHRDTVWAGSRNQPYDNAPGGWSPFMQGQEENKYLPSPFGWVQIGRMHAVHDNACFIPATSALGLRNYTPPTGTPQLFSAISIMNEFHPYALYTPFQAYYAPDVNEQHTQLTSGNRAFALLQLSGNGNRLGGDRPINLAGWVSSLPYNATANGIAINVATFNFTVESFERQLHTVQVNNGGLIYVNRQGLNPDAAVTFNDPATYGTNIMPRPGTFVMTTGDCGATVTLKPGGVFELGTPGATDANGYKAEVQFLSGSVLDIDGGSLVINSHSTLRMRAGSLLIINGFTNVVGFGNIIVEPGARLVIRPNAQITLQNDDSRLTLQGEFAIAANSTFQPTGNGHVIFGLPDGSGNNNLEIDGSTSHFILRGSSPSHVMAKVEPGTHIQPTYWGDFEFTIENGTVEMNEDAWINCADARVRLVNATFKGERSASRHGYRFVMVRNYQRETIRLCRFEGAQTGLLAALNASTSSYVPMYDNLTFTNCRIGLHSDGNGLRLRNCYFDNTGYARGLAGWRMDNTFSADNRAEHVTAKNFDDGFLFYGGAGSMLTVESPQITNNVYGITFSGEGTLRGECGAVFLNNYGIRVEGPAALDLSNGSQFSVVNNGFDSTVGQGGNQPAPATSRNIDLTGAREFTLERGHNDFAGRDPYTAGITGILVTLSSPPARLAAHGNRWNIGDRAPTNQIGDAFIRWDGPGYYVPCIVEDGEPAGSPFCDVDPCVVPLRPGVYVKCWDTQGRCSTCEPITTPYVTADSLHHAVERAMSYRHAVDSTSTDAVAIQMLKAILMLPLADTTAEEAQVLEKAYRALQEIYASSLDADVQAQAYANREALDQVIDAKLAAAIADGGIVNPVFYLLMDKALAAHAAGDLAGARTSLEEARAQANPLTQGFYDYWDCSLAATQDLRDSLITDIEYFERLLTCSQPQSAGRGVQPQSIEDFLAEQDAKTAARRAAQQAKATAQARIQLAPNPTTGAVTVSLADAPTGPVTLTLRDLTGQVVRRWERTATVSKANAWTLDLAGVAPGVYLIEVGTTARTEMRRLVIGTGGPASRP